MVSNHCAPAISSCRIMEFREKGDALWSMTNCNFVDPGFGTAWIGILYMPGKSSGLKGMEKWLLVISSAHCSRKNRPSTEVFGRWRDTS